MVSQTTLILNLGCSSFLLYFKVQEIESQRNRVGKILPFRASCFPEEELVHKYICRPTGISYSLNGRKLKRKSLEENEASLPYFYSAKLATTTGH